MKATIVFLDESGILMAPLVRRSWAPRGQTPILLQRGRSYSKVSAIAVLTVNTKGGNPHLFFRLHPNQNINSDCCIDFLKQLKKNVRGSIVLVWDRLRAHISNRTETFLKENKDKIRPFLFPPYAPELNPVEYFWSYIKMNPLVNWAPENDILLTQKTKRTFLSVQKNRTVLQSFIDHAPISFLPK